MPITTNSHGRAVRGEPNLRIVLSRTDRVGDLILSTPAIATMRRSFPQARITMVCSRYNSVVVADSSDIDELITVAADADPVAVGRGLRGADLAIA